MAFVKTERLAWQIGVIVMGMRSGWFTLFKDANSLTTGPLQMGRRSETMTVSKSISRIRRRRWFSPAQASACVGLHYGMDVRRTGIGWGIYAEFTNSGPTPVDMTGWQFDDNHRLTGTSPNLPTSLSAFGTVAPGQSVILTDDDANNFRTVWGLDPSSVEVIGGNTTNIGRSDEINLYDNTNTLVDRLTFNDQATAGDPTKSPSYPMALRAYILPARTPPNETASLAVKATASDSFGSRTSAQGELGNPGPVATPEPASIGMLAMAGLLIGRRARRQA